MLWISYPPVNYQILEFNPAIHRGGWKMSFSAELGPRSSSSCRRNGPRSELWTLDSRCFEDLKIKDRSFNIRKQESTNPNRSTSWIYSIWWLYIVHMILIDTVYVICIILETIDSLKHGCVDNWKKVAVDMFNRLLSSTHSDLSFYDYSKKKCPNQLVWVWWFEP